MKKGSSKGKKIKNIKQVIKTIEIKEILDEDEYNQEMFFKYKKLQEFDIDELDEDLSLSQLKNYNEEIEEEEKKRVKESKKKENYEELDSELTSTFGNISLKYRQHNNGQKFLGSNKFTIKQRKKTLL
jgi:hypothetical protein